MALVSKISFSVLLILLLVLLSFDLSQSQSIVTKISSALQSKGYVAMALILEQTLPTLLQASGHNNTTVASTEYTIFCPPDTAFFGLKYPQPPLTLLQYHIVPTKLDRKTLLESSSSSSLRFESKVDTLLKGHPLVVTTLPKRGSGVSASLNQVKVTDPEIYNDGHIVVHGVQDFFDPALQVLQYPWYDNAGAGAGNVPTDSRHSCDDGWVKLDILDRMLTIVAVLVGLALAYAIFNVCVCGLLPNRIPGYHSIV